MLGIVLLVLSIIFGVSVTASEGSDISSDLHPNVDFGVFGRRKTCTIRSARNPRISDVPAIHAAFRKCGRGGLIVFPQHETYHINELLEIGCVGCEVRLDGTLLQSNNVSYWETVYIPHPFQNSRLTNIVQGARDMLFHSPKRTGLIDGQSQAWLDAAMGTPSMLRPILWTTANSTNVTYDGIRFRNSPMWFNFVVRSSHITFTNLDIRAATRNTTTILRNNDGFDTYQSDDIVIRDLYFNSGDDCVSFKPNSTNVVVENAYCAGSHGVSVGSLAQYPGVYDIVANITVKNVTFTNRADGSHTQQGVRIKTWPGGYGSGEVHNVTYKDIVNFEVDTPIMLDTCYMNNASYCGQHPAQLAVWDVWISNVTGTSSGSRGDRVTSLICTPGTLPCELYLSDIDLTPPSGNPVYICRDVNPDIGVPCTQG